MPGHEYHPGANFVVRSDWQFGQELYQGTINDEPFCMQVERHGHKYRLFHWGTRADVMAMKAGGYMWLLDLMAL